MSETPVMTPAQQATVDHFKGYNVPASWFTGEFRSDGQVEVVAIGDTFVWSILISPDGDYHSQEAQVGPFSTGIEV